MGWKITAWAGKKMGLSEIKNWTGLKQGTLFWERKQMQFWNIEKVACVTHRSVLHSIQTTAALIKFGAQYFKRNMNHTEGDSLRTLTGPAHTTSKEHQVRAAAPRTRDSSCRGDAKTCVRFLGKLMGWDRTCTNALTWGALGSEFPVR